MVYIDGVYQNKSTYSVANQVLTFSTAPATSASIEVLTFTQTTINAPTSNSVGTTALIDDSVTSPKLGHALTLQGNTVFNGSIQLQNISIPDNYALRLGSSQDVQFYHDGNHARLRNATGNFNLQADDFHLTDASNTTLRFRVDADGATDIRYNGVTKLLTTATGVTANGIVTATTFSGDLNGTINTATTATTQANGVANTTIATTAHVTNKITQGTISPTFTGIPAAPTAANTVNSTQLATTAFVSNKITELIGGAPSTLNDLNELAAAINDDANYNSTLTTALATKLPLAGGTMTGDITNSQSVFNITNDDIRLKTSGAETMLRAVTNGAVELMHNNVVRIATTSSGAVVTSLLTLAQGSTNHTNHSIHANSNGYQYHYGGANGLYLGDNSDLSNAIGIRNDNFIDMTTGGVERMRINSAGIVDIGKSVFSTYPTGAKLNVYGDGEGFRLDGTGATSRSIRFRNVGVNGTSNAIIVSDGTLQLKNEDPNAAMYFNSVRDMEFQVTSGNGTAGNITFKSYNTEVMRIDGANNRVGIGVQSPQTALHVDGHFSFTKNGTTGNRWILIDGADGTYAGTMNIQAGFGSSAAGGAVKLYAQAHATYPGSVWIGRGSGAAGDIMFGDGGIGPASSAAIQMALTSGGDLLIGNSTVQPSSNHNNQAGFGYDKSSAQLQIASTTNNAQMELSRNSANDGNWITFRKQSNILGNIGTYGGTLYIGSTNGGIMFNGTSIEPTTGGASRSSGTVDLGSSNYQFKDAKFSGQVQSSTVQVGTDSNDPGEIYIADASTTAYTLGIIGTGTRTFEFRGSSSGADYNSYFTNPSSGKHNLHVNGYVSIEAGQRLYLDGSGDTYFVEYSANEVGVYTGGAVRAKWSAGNYLPGADNAYDLGATSARWRNLYTTDLHLSNEGKPEGNQVDGTTGNWTIQEGEENLYIINNKSGKKYKFALEEIS
jgi:hypothetical protein